MGYIEKKEKTTESPDSISQKIEFRAAVFSGKFGYRCNGNKVTIKQNKGHMIILDIDNIDDFIAEVKAIKEKIKAIQGV